MAAAQKPKARFVAYEDLSSRQVEALRNAVELAVPGIEPIPGGNVFVAVHEYYDDEQGHFMTSLYMVNKLPVVHDSLEAAIKFYEKIKRSNCVCRLTMKTAEITVHKAVQISRPLQSCLVVLPLKTIDNMLLRTLHSLQLNVPAINLPSDQLMEKTKNYLSSAVKPCEDCFGAMKKRGIRKTRCLLKTGLKVLKLLLLPVTVKNKQVLPVEQRENPQDIDNGMKNEQVLPPVEQRSRPNLQDIDDGINIEQVLPPVEQRENPQDIDNGINIEQVLPPVEQRESSGHSKSK